MGFVDSKYISDELAQELRDRADNLKAAKKHVFNGYNCPRDNYKTDEGYIRYLVDCLTKAHTHLQKL